MSNAENARRAMQVFGLGRSREKVKKAVGHINALEDERNALKKALEELITFHNTDFSECSMWEIDRDWSDLIAKATDALADLEEAQKA